MTSVERSAPLLKSGRSSSPRADRPCFYWRFLLRTNDGDCPRDERPPYHLEDIPDEVIERIIRIALEELSRYLQLARKVKR